MKYALIIAGVILLLFAAIALGRYVFDYSELSEYGKGYIWGKVILLVLGILLLLKGIRWKRT